LLSSLHDATFEDLSALAFDTTIYWAQHDLPRLAEQFEEVRALDPALARQAEPLLEHLLAWDGRAGIGSTQATLCVAWYQELCGAGYPGETLKPQYEDNPVAAFYALVRAATALQQVHGDWRVPWGNVHRIQRHANVADLMGIPFDDRLPSLPSMAVPGQLGVVLTTYYRPGDGLGLGAAARNAYGLVGTTYLGVFEFGPRVRGATLVQFGASGNPASPHFFDQARLLAEGRLKPELFYWEDVLAGARESYHPGETVAGGELPAPPAAQDLRSRGE
jgi:acyl-homoserine lactone acylase PvdQ